MTASPTATETKSPSGTSTASRTASLSVTSSQTLSRISTPTASETMNATSTSRLVSEDSGSTRGESTGTLENLAMDFGPIVGGMSLLFVCLFYILHKRRKNQSVTKEYSTVLEQYVKQQGSQVEENGSATIGIGIEEEGKVEKHAFPHNLSSVSTEIDEEGGRGRLRLSSLTVSESNVNPLRTAAATRVSDSVMQSIQIKESSPMRDSKGCSTVKVISVKTPNLSKASKTNETAKLQLAKIEDIDPSGMKWIDRGILKLRKWKAFILAEVSPMVEVETERKAKGPGDITSNNCQRRDAFIQRLAYAKKVGGDRTVIDSEARSHSLSRREVVSQRQRKKKEFQAVPRNMGRTSFYKRRSHKSCL